MVSISRRSLFGYALLTASLFSATAWCLPTADDPTTRPVQNITDILELLRTPRADDPSGSRSRSSSGSSSPLAGYLSAVFLGSDPYVYFYLSNGNDPIAFRPLNKGQPILRPTQGTGGVRDPALVKGAPSSSSSSSSAGNKWYIVGTDLDIDKTSWSAAQRTGSRGILVWESTDLVNWVNERLVVVEDSTAGMVWAPEAIWDPSKKQYMVYWASKFYAASDPAHTGSPSNTRIRYAYTPDFRTFSAPQTYIDKAPTDIIDLTILPVEKEAAAAATSGDAPTPAYLRFMKDESKKTVFVEYTAGSENGLFGNWTRPGGSTAVIQSGVEGPAAYWDNQVAGKAHLLLDFYGSDGYRPYESTQPESNSNGGGGWTASSRAAFPTNLRHGSVLPVTAEEYAALAGKWL